MTMYELPPGGSGNRSERNFLGRFNSVLSTRVSRSRVVAEPSGMVTSQRVRFLEGVMSFNFVKVINTVRQWDVLDRENILRGFTIDETAQSQEVVDHGVASREWRMRNEEETRRMEKKNEMVQ